MIRGNQRGALAITLLVLVPTLTACAGPAATEPTGESVTESKQPPTDAAPMPPDADERHLCGQVSALEGIRYRSDWEHEQGLIDDVAYASRVAAIEDGWKYMVLGRTDVSPAIKEAQRTLSSGGIGYENTDFQRAVSDVGLACDEAGSLIAISALPGQGG